MPTLDNYKRFFVVLILLFGGFVFVYYMIGQSTYKDQLKFLFDDKKEMTKLMVKEKLEDHRVSSRIESIVEVNGALISQALKENNRDLLIKNRRFMSLWDRLKKEDENIALMHFHDAEGRSFIRLHSLYHHGDDLKELRPMITATRESQEKQEGFEYGKHGFYYRVSVPIVSEDKLLGALEIGVRDRWVEDSIIKNYPNIKVVLFAKKGVLERFDELSSSSRCFGEFCTYRNSLFVDALPKSLPNDAGLHEIEIDGKLYIYESADSIELKDFQGHSVGKAVVFYDVSEFAKEFSTMHTKEIWLILALFVIVATISYYRWLTYADKLSKSKKLYMDILEKLPLGVVIHRFDGEIFFANEHFKKLVEFEGDIRGVSLFEFADEKTTKRVKEHIEAGEFRHTPEIGEYEMLTKNKRTLWVEATVSSITIEGEEFIFPVMHDISEKRARVKEIESLNKELGKMAEVGSLISAIIHQWNQPLNYISLVADSMVEMYDIEGGISKKSVEKISEKITKQALFMSDTMNDFKNYFSPDKIKNSFSIKAVLNQSIGLLDFRFKKSSVTISVDVSEDIKVYGFANDLQQVFFNILNNAVEALLEQGKREGRIDISIKRDGSSAVVIFRDSGDGFSLSLLPDKIFQEYFTTKGEKGTGLGLSISKSIVEHSFDGSMRAYNHPEGGACIEIVLKSDEQNDEAS
jgi:PAS domain S-box-containing protein